MHLTSKELEIMALLWDSDVPMTATEIVNASENRSWKQSSIFIILKTLLAKKAVVFSHNKHTVTNVARAYKPGFTAEEYAVSLVCDTEILGKCINMDVLIELFKKAAKH